MNESLISIVAPLEADSDARVIEAFIQETAAVLSGIVTHHEIILVDDGAPNATVDRVRELLGTHDFLRLIRLSRHFGEEAAITAGLEVAIGDYVVVMLPKRYWFRFRVPEGARLTSTTPPAIPP